MTEDEQFKDLEKRIKLARDRNVASVADKMLERSDIGFKKYGTTTERNDIDLQGWLTHLQEELMDASIYIERIKNELRQK